MTVTCRQCGRPFKTFPSYLRRRPTGPFCSRECQSDACTVERKCVGCGRRFWTKRWRTQKYCGSDCRHLTCHNAFEYLNRFIKKAEVGCWEWLASCTKAGYGTLKVEGHHIYAHRAAYAAWIGKIPAGKLVCHHCDNPRCLNPAHLFLGTHKDNTADAIRKGRFYQHRMPRARKFDPVEAARLRESGKTYKQIAVAVGCSETYVWYLLHRAKSLEAA